MASTHSSITRASSGSDEERRPGRPRERRRLIKKKDKKQDIRYLVRDGPRMTSSWENPMIAPPSQTNVTGKGSIFDVYIEVKYGGKEFVVDKYDDYDPYPEREAAGSESDSEVDERVRKGSPKTESEKEAVRSSSEGGSERVERVVKIVRKTSDVQEEKGETGSKSARDTSDTESEVQTKEASDINNETVKIVAASEDGKIKESEKVAPKEASPKPMERSRRTRTGTRLPLRPGAYVPRQYGRPPPPPREREYFPKPAEIQGMNIFSPHLLKAIRSLVAYYPAQLLNGKLISIDAPFKMLYHYYHDLERLLEEGRAEEEAKSRVDDDTPEESDETPIDLVKERNHHLSVLLDFLKPKHLNMVKPAEDRFRDGVSTYDNLWLLFKPGCDLYAKVGGMFTGFVLVSAKEDVQRYTNPQNRTEERLEHFWAIKAWHLCSFGGKFTRESRSFKIKKFEGEQDITTLAVFPSHYLDRVDGGKTRLNLETRGSKYFEYLRAAPAHVKYKGPAWSSRIYPKVWKKEPKLQYDGEIIIDPSAFQKYASESPAVAGGRDRSPARRIYVESGSSSGTDVGDDEPNRFDTDSQWADYENIIPKTRKSLTAHQYYLIERRVDGFALKQKRWMGFDIEGIEELTWSPDENSAMSQLILPRRDIEIIKALSSRHMAGNTKQWGADFIPGKGEGQVFLLHGPPGTGKTYTVECVADFTRRPLVYLTVADIGTDEVLMEMNLSRWFTVAASWQAVILIDEADVFLERRQGANLQRNSLVSVFLRCMEYYPGMLFLTTNRIGQIDDAFLSRTSVALTYEPLNPSVQLRIWDGFLSKLERERDDMVVTDRARTFLEEDEDMKSIPWNGREIRNALQTAIALAIYDSEQAFKRTGKKPAKVEVDKEHFLKVVLRRKTFIEYRDSIRRQTEEQRALGEGSRALPKR